MPFRFNSSKATARPSRQSQLSKATEDPILQPADSGLTYTEQTMVRLWQESAAILFASSLTRKFRSRLNAFFDTDNRSEKLGLGVGHAVDGLEWKSSTDRLLQSAGIFKAQIIASGQEGQNLPQQYSGSIAFDASDQRAQLWANDHAGIVVQEITDEVRGRIQEIILDALQGEHTADEAAEMITRVIGLTGRQAAAVENSYNATIENLVNNGMNRRAATKRARELAKEYRARLITSRGNMIARTEIMRAANNGRLLAWAQAIDAGVIDTTMRKEWRTYPGYGANGPCPVCLGLRGVTVSVLDEFPTGALMPPAHPYCRCTAILVPLKRGLPRTAEVGGGYVTPKVDPIGSKLSANIVQKAIDLAAQRRGSDGGSGVKKFNPNHGKDGRFSSGFGSAPHMDTGHAGAPVDREREGFKAIMKPYLERLSTHNRAVYVPSPDGLRGGWRDRSEMHAEIEAGGKVRDEIARRHSAVINSAKYQSDKQLLDGALENARNAFMRSDPKTLVSGIPSAEVSEKFALKSKHYEAANAFNEAYSNSPVTERFIQEKKTLREEENQIRAEMDPIISTLKDKFDKENPGLSQPKIFDDQTKYFREKNKYITSNMPKDLTDRLRAVEARTGEIGRLQREAMYVGLTHAAAYGRGVSDTPSKKIVLSEDNPYRSDSNYMEKMNAHFDARNAYKNVSKKTHITNSEREKLREDYMRAASVKDNFDATVRRNVIKEVLGDVGVKFSDGKVSLEGDENPGVATGDALLTTNLKRSKAITSLENIAPYLPKRWVKMSNEKHAVSVYWNKSERGYCSSRGKIVTAADNTTLHEMIHNAENTVPEIRHREKEFHAYRTQGEASQSLRRLEPGVRYKSSEVSNPDKFYDSYCGKTYEGGSNNFELTTMGYADMMWKRTNAKIDPEYEAWIWATIMMTS